MEIGWLIQYIESLCWQTLRPPLVIRWYSPLEGSGLTGDGIQTHVGHNPIDQYPLQSLPNFFGNL
jgi:hypothetical protein